MNHKWTNRGFGLITHPTRDNHPKVTRLIQESSAVGDYEDSPDNPGSSYLWIGADHHLNREEVEELVIRMQGWLAVGRLLPAEDDVEDDDG